GEGTVTEAKMREICTCPLTGRTIPPEQGIGDPGRARGWSAGDCIRRDDCRGCRTGRVTERTVTGVRIALFLTPLWT
ncbi:MAG TPA: hypothetical protein PLN56_09935, partial [Methanoregulaceae archaeon]|nr:hypothetical protein [Methanoregulaceae archaeon]